MQNMLSLLLRFLQQLHVRYHVGDIADTNHTVPYRKETNGYWHLFSVLTIPEYPQRCFYYIIQNGSFIRPPHVLMAILHKDCAVLPLLSEIFFEFYFSIFFW